MTRRRNFLPFAGFLICGIAFLSYPLFFSRFPATRDVPWASWLLFVLGLALAGLGLLRAFRQPEQYRGKVLGPIFSVLSLAFLGLFVFMTMVMARQLPESAGAPQVGEKAPGFTLQDTQGRPVQLANLLEPQAGSSGSWVLLIFYRGYW